MMRIGRCLTATVLLCSLRSVAFAQNDSTWLDAGTIRIRRDFAATMRIRGEDMEKMPYTNLGEAITAWLYGAYTDRNSLSYVVDGIYVNDGVTLVRERS